MGRLAEVYGTKDFGDIFHLTRSFLLKVEKRKSAIRFRAGLYRNHTTRQPVSQ
jgi:hypothetical protein